MHARALMRAQQQSTAGGPGDRLAVRGPPRGHAYVVAGSGRRAGSAAGARQGRPLRPPAPRGGKGHIEE